MHEIDIKMLRNLKKRIYMTLTVLAMILALVGCATNQKIKDDASAKEEASVKDEASVKEEASAARGPSVERLGNGREGFIITEVPKIDESSRRDFDRAVAMLEKQDYGRAIDLLEKIIEQSPGVTAPYVDIAIAYQRIGKPEQAEEHLKTALELFPGHPAASNEYGLLYRKTGRFTEARAIYEKAIAHFPDYYPAHRNLGILCDLYLNDPACALDHYEIYSGARPEDEQVKLWIADLRARLERQAEGR